MFITETVALLLPFSVLSMTVVAKPPRGLNFPRGDSCIVDNCRHSRLRYRVVENNNSIIIKKMKKWEMKLNVLQPTSRTVTNVYITRSTHINLKFYNITEEHNSCFQLPAINLWKRVIFVLYKVDNQNIKAPLFNCQKFRCNWHKWI